MIHNNASENAIVQTMYLKMSQSIDDASLEITKIEWNYLMRRA